MKVLAVLLLVVILGVALLVKLGGVTSFDPAAGVEQFLADVQPGMTWQQVVDIKEPKKYAVYTDNPDRLLGHGAISKFNADKFAANTQKQSYPLGFFFDYTFDAEHAYRVVFDGQGLVEAIEPQMTTADFFGGN